MERRQDLATLNHVTISLLCNGSMTTKAAISSYPLPTGWQLMNLADLMLSNLRRTFQVYRPRDNLSILQRFYNKEDYDLILPITTRRMAADALGWLILCLATIFLKLRDNVRNVCSSPVDHTSSSQNWTDDIKQNQVDLVQKLAKNGPIFSKIEKLS